ncbi:peptidylprolyl isomerase, partial [Pseudomonadota bacterium]
MKHLISALILTLASHAVIAEPQELDRIVAIVDEEAISHSELASEISTIVMQLRQQGTPLPSMDILEKQVLERLIIKHLKKQIATRNNIIIDDETLNNALNNIAEQNNLSLAQLKSVLEKDGMDFNAYRESIRHEILHARLRQRHVDSRINITTNEVDQFLAKQKQTGAEEEEFRLGHILVSLPEGASPSEIEEARNEGQTLLDKLASGEDFAQLAISESDGQLALTGGDLGWRKLGEIPTLFASAVSKMKKQDVSQLIRSPSGFHIIKLVDVKSGERHVVKQINARHILIKTNELIDEELARKKLLELKSRIEQGDDFGELAKSHSDDTGSAAKGGDLGWAGPG